MACSRSLVLEFGGFDELVTSRKTTTFATAGCAPVGVYATGRIYSFGILRGKRLPRLTVSISPAGRAGGSSTLSTFALEMSGSRDFSPSISTAVRAASPPEPGDRPRATIISSHRCEAACRCNSQVEPMCEACEVANPATDLSCLPQCELVRWLA
jgi:hypothetical protein